MRVTSAGLVTPRRVLNATWIAFAVGVACGIYLAAVAGIVILLIGALSIAAGVLYTGGPRPYGYAGLGEVFVFLFFGLVAVNGSYYVQLEQLDALPLGLSIAVGFLATAILVVNNVRDLETDRRAGKMTLAVRMGRHNAVVLYRGLVLGAFVVLPLALLAGGASWLPLIGLLALPMAIETDAGDDQPHRRPGAERGPGRYRRAARRLQPAGLDRPAAGELMRLASVEVIPYALPFKEPYVTARGRLEQREMVLLRLRSDDGLIGLGRSGAAVAARRRDASPGRHRAGGAGEARRGWMRRPWEAAPWRSRRRPAAPRSRHCWTCGGGERRVTVAGSEATPEPVACNATLVAGEPGAVARGCRSAGRARASRPSS